MSEVQESIGLRGMFRIQIDEEGEIVGDSGWHQNQITNDGFNQYLVMSLGSISGSKFVTHAAIGTGGVPATGDTALAGEQSVRAALTAATTTGSKTLNLLATFASSASFVTATKNISNIGLFNTSTAATGTLFAGNTYASSNVATNQNINVTYQIVFS